MKEKILLISLLVYVCACASMTEAFTVVNGDRRKGKAVRHDQKPLFAKSEGKGELSSKAQCQALKY